MQWLHIYLTVIILIAGTAAVCTWLAKIAAYRLTILDHPEREAHKSHRHPIPVLGGAAMFAAWLMVIFAGVLLYPLFEAVFHEATTRLVATPRVVLPQLAVIIGGAAAMLLLGLLDDINPLNAFQKLSGQVIIALVVAIYGVRITVFVSHPALTWLITAAWIVVIINAINFFDNTDGLAAGTTCIAAVIFMFAAAMQQQFFVAVLAASVCGMGLGFLFFNWPPAKIFMGDAGSHLLGYMLAVTGALTTFYSPDTGMTRLSVLIPVLVLAVPIFDFFAVILIRAHNGRPIYQGDHSHISHRFLDMGLGKSATVVLVCLLTFIIGASALTLFWLPLAGTAIILTQAIALLLFVTILHAAKIGKGESFNEVE